MAIVNWSANVSVGISSIDSQHKELFDHINNFYENLSKNSSKESLTELINALSDYTIFHFSNEEKLMQQHAFPGFVAHKNEHIKFIQTITAYKERLSSGKLILSIEITNFLKNWIVEHISVADKAYSKFLVDRGVH